MTLAGLLNSTEHWRRFIEQHFDNFLLSSTRIFFIIFGYLVLRFVAFRLIRGFLDSTLVKLSGDLLKARKARVRALNSLLSSAVGFILTFITMITILDEANIKVLPLLTSAGVIGLAVAFGAQKLVKDVISGFFILMEDQYGVGDYVTIGIVTGCVEDLEMRTTRIRDASGKLYIISNGDITQVCNHSRGQLKMSVDVAIAGSADLEKARQLIDEVGKSIAGDNPKSVQEPFRCDGLSQITAASTTIRLVGSVTPAEQEQIRTELNTRIRQILAENAIPLA